MLDQINQFVLSKLKSAISCLIDDAGRRLYVTSLDLTRQHIEKSLEVVLNRLSDRSLPIWSVPDFKLLGCISLKFPLMIPTLIQKRVTTST